MDNSQGYVRCQAKTVKSILDAACEELLSGPISDHRNGLETALDDAQTEIEELNNRIIELEQEVDRLSELSNVQAATIAILEARLSGAATNV